MKKNAVRCASVFAALAMALSLAACSGSGDAEGTTLTIYGWKGSETEPANIPEINAAFEAAHPGVTIDYEFLAAGDTINQRLQPELLAGDGPDVFMVDRTSFVTYTESGYLADLSDEEWADDLASQIRPFVSVDDAVYAAPLEMLPIGLYANMEILNKVGITEFPKTHDDFIAALEALQAADLPGLAVPDKGTWTDSAILNGIASSLVYGENKNWDDDFMAGDADFSDWKPAVEQLLALDEAGYIDLKAGLGVDEWGQGLEDFKAGKTAFLYQGGWNLVDFSSSVPSVQFGPWPASDADSSVTMFPGLDWAVNAASDNQDLAKEYVAFFTASENLEGFLAAESGYSPFEGGASPKNDAASLINEAVDDGRFRLDASLTWFNATNEAKYATDIQALILGQVTVDQMLDDWNSFRD